MARDHRYGPNSPIARAFVSRTPVRSAHFTFGSVTVRKTLNPGCAERQGGLLLRRSLRAALDPRRYLASDGPVGDLRHDTIAAGLVGFPGWAAGGGQPSGKPRSKGRRRSNAASPSAPNSATSLILFFFVGGRGGGEREERQGHDHRSPRHFPERRMENVIEPIRDPVRHERDDPVHRCLPCVRRFLSTGPPKQPLPFSKSPRRAG